MFTNWDATTLKAMIISIVIIFAVGNLIISFLIDRKEKRDIERFENMTQDELDEFINSRQKNHPSS